MRTEEQPPRFEAYSGRAYEKCGQNTPEITSTFPQSTRSQTRSVALGARSYYQLPAFRQDDQAKAKEVTVKIAAQRLDVSEWIVRRMIEEKMLPARQVIVCAPWQIPVEALDLEEIRQQATNIKNRLRVPQNHQDEEQEALFSET